MEALARGAPMPRGTGKGIHILVVDDDPSVREALEAALAPEYIVHAVATSGDACALLSRQPVATIILDAILAHEHGLDGVPQLRKASHAPILVLTGHSNEDLAIRAVWANVDGYLKKPISLQGVRAAIEGVLSPGEDTSDLAARIRRALEEFPPRSLGAAELASRLGMTEGHLRRIFRAAYGQTPRQYLAELRVRRAEELLRTTDQSVKQAALQVGFTNLAVFRRVFKRVFGRTPKASAGRTTPSAMPPMSKT